MTDSAPVGYYEWLDFNSPMTSETADRLVARLAATGPGSILDVGCGWAELLLRLLASCPEATGFGIDHDQRLTERAETNAADRGLSSRVSFDSTLGDEPEPADLVLNVGAEHVFGTLADALVELHRLVRPGGRLLLGTQVWERPPTPEIVAAIGELPTLPGLVEQAASAGFRPLDLVVSSARDWDHFEFGYLADWEQFVMAPTTQDEADQARLAADSHRQGYLRRRGVLGFAFLTLGRPSPPTRA